MFKIVTKSLKAEKSIVGKSVKSDEKLREKKRSRRTNSLRGNEVKKLTRNLLKYPLAQEQSLQRLIKFDHEHRRIIVATTLEDLKQLSFDKYSGNDTDLLQIRNDVRLYIIFCVLNIEQDQKLIDYLFHYMSLQPPRIMAPVVAVATREPVEKPVENAPSSCQLINSYLLDVFVAKSSNLDASEDVCSSILVLFIVYVDGFQCPPRDPDSDGHPSITLNSSPPFYHR